MEPPSLISKAEYLCGTLTLGLGGRVAGAVLSAVMMEVLIVRIWRLIFNTGKWTFMFREPLATLPPVHT